METSSIGQEGQTGSQDNRSTQPLWKSIPLSQNGSILITTRTRSAASELVEDSDIVIVEPMDEMYAVALLNKKLGIQSDQRDIVELAEALEYMPLAIVQAAAYISQRAPRYTVQQYIQKFHRNDQERMSLLDHEAGHLRRDWEARNSIIITWQISFEHIYERRRSAADLLSLMSFFDRQGIPEALLWTQSEYKHGGSARESDDEDTTLVWDDDEDFENDILILRNYSFISVNKDATTFEMHGLVQLATRKWLKAHEQLERWKQQYIKNLCSEFPTGNYENWVKCQALFPHAKTALTQQPESDRSLIEWASILYRAAWYAWAKGNRFDAEKMSVQAMKITNKILSPEHKNTLHSMSIVALTYKLGGRWDEAEELEVQVMETRKRVLGLEHPDTLITMNNLATTYLNQGRWKEAEELGVQVMETRKRVLGQEHPRTLATMNNLALTYSSQGRWKETEELEVQVMETIKRVLGQEHPHTLISMHNLACTWKEQGLQNKALVLMEDCFQLRNHVLGSDHPYTLLSLSFLNKWKIEK